jgi:hypothetical protein
VLPERGDRGLEVVALLAADAELVALDLVTFRGDTNADTTEIAGG